MGRVVSCIHFVSFEIFLKRLEGGGGGGGRFTRREFIKKSDVQMVGLLEKGS